AGAGQSSDSMRASGELRTHVSSTMGPENGSRTDRYTTRSGAWGNDNRRNDYSLTPPAIVFARHNANHFERRMMMPHAATKSISSTPAVAGELNLTSRQDEINRAVYSSRKVYRYYLSPHLTLSETACLLKYQPQIAGHDVL